MEGALDGAVHVEVVGHDQAGPGPFDAAEHGVGQARELLGPGGVGRLRALVDDGGARAGRRGALGGGDVGAQGVRARRAAADGADLVAAGGELGDDGAADGAGGAEDDVQVGHGGSWFLVK
ncbi:hypothetical protein LO763_10270 [Glycomyces sp. A-F 0318]|nr:hypothetical protein [Glycomyces amatae]MCD0444007.1 hypothetical protein [Glycomyces amatae]